jgi:hypothetical protein
VHHPDYTSRCWETYCARGRFAKSTKQSARYTVDVNAAARCTKECAQFVDGGGAKNLEREGGEELHRKERRFPTDDVGSQVAVHNHTQAQKMKVLWLATELINTLNHRFFLVCLISEPIGAFRIVFTCCAACVT